MTIRYIIYNINSSWLIVILKAINLTRDLLFYLYFALYFQFDTLLLYTCHCISLEYYLSLALLLYHA